MYLLTLKGKKDEGAYAVHDEHGEKVLFMFEEEDDATRYALMLEDHPEYETEMAIFSLIAKLGLDGSSFEGGLKRATSMTDKFRSSVGAQLGGALSVAAIGAFASKVIETADAMMKAREENSQ